MIGNSWTFPAKEIIKDIGFSRSLQQIYHELIKEE